MQLTVGFESEVEEGDVFTSASALLRSMRAIDESFESAHANRRRTSRARARGDDEILKAYGYACDESSRGIAKA